jgi:hypothetical protein
MNVDANMGPSLSGYLVMLGCHAVYVAEVDRCGIQVATLFTMPQILLAFSSRFYLGVDRIAQLSSPSLHYLGTLLAKPTDLPNSITRMGIAFTVSI